MSDREPASTYSLSIFIKCVCAFNLLIFLHFLSPAFDSSISNCQSNCNIVFAHVSLKFNNIIMRFLSTEESLTDSLYSRERTTPL